MTERATYVYRDGELVEKHLAAPLIDTGPRSGVRSPMYISDHLAQPLQHMANGKTSESKSEHRRWTKEAGCVEVGTQTFKPRVPIKLDRRKRAQDIAQAIEQLSSR